MKNTDLSKFPATTVMATSWLKLPISISEVFEWEASPVEGQSLQQKDLKHKKPKDVGHAKF